MFDYTLPGAPPESGVPVWSQAPLQPLAPGPLTPFSYSVLAEVINRSWFALYDRLGFAPAPRPRLLRRHQGRAYLNLSLTARLEAEQAGVEPLALRINGQPFPLAAWQKPGLLAGFKLSRPQKKLDELPAALAQQMDAATTQARAWYLKTRELRWSQAEVLQVMEEIERMGQEPMAGYLVARHGLERGYAKLLAGLAPGVDARQGLPLVNHALCDLSGLVETEMAAALVALPATVDEPAATADWLRAGDFTRWQDELPSRATAALDEFLAAYGQRTLGEAEMARPRWDEKPAPLLRTLLACLETPPQRPAGPVAGAAVQTLLSALAALARKPAHALLQRLHDLHRLQSRALYALAYVWAGTRRWALAAAKEAMADGRLDSPDEVFFFELEELKQMMTGEWNISAAADIRATLAARRTDYQAEQAQRPAPLLFGDREAQPAVPGAPAGAGCARGPLRLWAEDGLDGWAGAILGGEALDSGGALALPLAAGFIAAGGSPLDPLAAAARAWPRPAVVGLGDAFWALAAGVETTVDGDAGTVKQ